MRSLLVTTALVLPLSLGTAFAQDTATETEAPDPEEAAQEAEQTAEEVEGGTESGETQTIEAQPADEGAQPAETQEVEVEEVESTDTQETESADAPSGEAVQQEQGPNELRIDWITGATVMSPDGESIGNINDLIIDGENGQLTAAVVGVGGFLGIGQKQIAMSWDSLQIDYDANEITSDITQEEAEQAPEYVFRDQEQAPAPEGGTGGDTGMGTGGDTGGGMGTGGGTTGGVQ